MKFKAALVAGLLLAPQGLLAQIDTRTACDFEDIKDFVAWFKGSAENQKSATSDPLEAAFDEYDERGKKLELEFEPHKHDELGWPILPHLGGDWKETYVIVDDDTVEYYTTGGMLYNHYFLFKRQPCWTLVKFAHDRL